ncbi:hypothetical protein ABF173_002552 [Flavobacterium psychrophilum]
MKKEKFEELQVKALDIAKNFDNYTYAEVEIILEELNRHINSKRRNLVFKEV